MSNDPKRKGQFVPFSAIEVVLLLAAVTLALSAFLSSARIVIGAL